MKKENYYHPLKRILKPIGLSFLLSGALINTSYSQTAKQSSSTATISKASEEKQITSKEDLAKRSKFSKNFINSDGTRTSQVGGNYHYKDNEGKWQDINLNIQIQPTANSFFQNTTNDIKTYFPRTANAGMINMVLEDGYTFNWWKNTYLAYEYNNQLLGKVTPRTVQGEVTGSKLTYPQLYPSVSEEFVILDNGLENNIILHNSTPEMRNLPEGSNVQFGHFIPLEKGWNIRDEKGQIRKQDFNSSTFSIEIKGENRQLYFGHNILFDNSITKENALLIHSPIEKLAQEQRSAIANHVLAVQHSIHFVEGGIEVRLNVPTSWLLSPSRHYPVTIDPTVTITTAAPSSSYQGPLTHWFGYQRHASLYLQSEIGDFGTITALEYNSTTGGTAASVPTQIYFRTTPSETLVQNNWNSPEYTGGAHLALSEATNQGNTTGWKLLTLTEPYPYQSDNLIIMLSDKYGGSGSTKFYNQSSTMASRQVASRSDGQDLGDDVLLGDDGGRLHEIRIHYSPFIICEGVPENVTISTTVNTICPSTSFTLTSDIQIQTGNSIQWQSSVDGVNWNNIGGENTLPYLVLSSGQTVASSYRLILTCTNTSDEVISNVVEIALTDYLECYCTNTIPFICNDGDIITHVGFQEINNPSGCGQNGYTDYRTSQPTAQVTAGESYPFSATVGNGWDYESVGVWIDFNKNGRLDSLEGEYFPIGRGRNAVLTNTISIPTNALAGFTLMRVVVFASIYPLNSQVCGPTIVNESYGEMEDYAVFIHVPINSITVETAGNVAAEIDTNQGTLAMQSTITPSNAIQDVTWSIINTTGRATITPQGVVTAVSSGEVWAKATSTYDLTKQDSLLITLTNQIPPIDSIVVSTVGNIAAAINVPRGTLPHIATVYPSYASQDVTWSITHETGTGTIEQDGIVTAGISGYVWAKATSVQDATQKDSIRITITNHDLSISNLGGSQLSIYPNPTKDYVQISMKESHSALTLTVMDLNGKVLFENKIAANQLNTTYELDVKKYPEGVYLLKLNGDNHNSIHQLIRQ